MEFSIRNSGRFPRRKPAETVHYYHHIYSLELVEIMQNFSRAFSRCRGFFHMGMLVSLGISFLLLLSLLLLLLLLSQPTSWTPPSPPWRPRRGARNWSLNRGSNPQPLDFQFSISIILSPVSSPLNHAISRGISALTNVENVFNEFLVVKR